MNYASLHNFLLSPVWQGFIWLIFLFLSCFLCVHLARLLRFGWLYQKGQNKETAISKEQEKTPEKKENPPPSEPQPVYYIVEKKRKTRTSYSEPKRINFK